MDHEMKNVTTKSYVIGFALSLILTCFAFGVAALGSTVFHSAAYIIVVIFAIAQLLVQAKFFLHLTIKPETTYDISIIILTVVTLLLFVLGSIWIMWHLSINMMQM